MSTRLERLIKLLSTGSTLTVRSTAAKQIGAIAASQKSKLSYEAEAWKDLLALLISILPLLHAKSAETRTAAALAFEETLKVLVWNPDELHLDNAPSTNDRLSTPLLELSAFNLAHILLNGTKLLGSSGNEFKSANGPASEKDKAASRKMLSELGLADETGKSIEMDVDLDLDMSNSLSPVVDQPIASTSAIPDGMSARERNALKRKRKEEVSTTNKIPKLTRQISSFKEDQAIKVEEPQDKIVISSQTATKVELTETSEPVNEFWTNAAQCPFTLLFFHLCSFLSDPAWEIRHGSLLGLTALLKCQGANLGYIIGEASTSNEQAHIAMLEDLAYRLLQLLCLDRFSDFVGDSVSAPVREAAAQCLAMLDTLLNESQIWNVRDLLEKMTRQDYGVEEGQTKKYSWEVRHAGLSGLKFLVRDTSAEGMSLDEMVKLVEVSLIGLTDNDDDVRLAAAETLLPIAANLVQQSPDILSSLFDTLILCLSDLKDDLSASVGSVMILLSELLAAPNGLTNFTARHSLQEVVTKSFPYFRHTITSVRAAVLRMLTILFFGSQMHFDLVTEDLLSLLYQNIIVENSVSIVDDSLQIALRLMASTSKLVISDSTFNRWFGLVMTLIGQQYNKDLLYIASSASNGYSIDKHALKQDLSLISEERIISSRLKAMKFIAGAVKKYDPEKREEICMPFLKTHFDSHSALQRYMAAMMLCELLSSSLLEMSAVNRQICFQQLEAALCAAPNYAELYNVTNALNVEIQAAASALKKAKIAVPDQSQSADIVQALLSAIDTAPPKKAAPLLEYKARLETARLRLVVEKDRHNLYVEAALAAAIVQLAQIPAKMNPIIKGLMNSVKFEIMSERQQHSAVAIAQFLLLCTKAHTAGTIKANPSSKVIKNICAFLCVDKEETLVYDPECQEPIISSKLSDDTKPTRKVAMGLDEKESQTAITRRGAEYAVEGLVLAYGADVLQDAPGLWDLCVASMTGKAQDLEFTLDKEGGQQIIDNCSVLAAVCVKLPSHLAAGQLRFHSIWSCLAAYITSSHSQLRNSAARCLARIARSLTHEALHFIVDELLPASDNPKNVSVRRGVVEAVFLTISELDLQILPYLVFFIAPILARMTDSDAPTRLLAAQTFAILVKLVPLEAGADEPIGFSADIMAKRDEQRLFIRQLVEGSKADQYRIPIKVAVELRHYQIEGVSWLAFLTRFKLHGILCDDMGLGKTLQTIVIMASIKHERETKGQPHLPSIVICPPTLTGHWLNELTTYVTDLKAITYTGPKAARAAILEQISKIDVLVMSYDVVRNDADALSSLHYLFIVLDEGHIIKNSKTQLSKQVKRLNGEHRLLLSGTPIQNNVLELWSLFDFLMPGFLGDEKAFKEKYSKRIAASRDAKASSKEQEAGTLALDALHKQILPFLLRRLKENVLDDLPPKIIQDYHVEMAAFQRSLYQKAVDDTTQPDGSESGTAKDHVFQSLQYLRKLVSHPLLVMSPEDVANCPNNLHELSQAPKLEALRQILSDCGIGSDTKQDDDEDVGLASHRVLIFAQLKQTLDLIESDLFAAHMPSVTYMRLDGSVPAAQRHPMVQKFNSDPSVDCLLLTTHVGGLGLTLTGADTVVFMEHDWNPMKDLQAMDRAHRLGQKRVVNVYRLITLDTIEEKIMGLQKFKLNIANSVVNEDNAGLGTMDTDQVLDLFDANSSQQEASKKSLTGKLTRKAILEGLGDLPAE